MYKILLFFIISFLFSCNNHNEKITEKEFYTNGNLKAIHILKNGVKSDSSIYYYQNHHIGKILYYLERDTIFEKDFSEMSKLVCEGKNIKKKMTGKWKFYKNNGRIDKVIEYINLCGKQYVNQGWYFNNNGDTINNRSNYFKLIKKNGKWKINKKYELRFIYQRILSNDSELLLCLSPDVNKNYCNVNQVKFDSAYSNTNNLVAKIGFASSGEKNLKGFIKEFYNKKSGKSESKYTERIIFFDISIQVE